MSGRVQWRDALQRAWLPYSAYRLGVMGTGRGAGDRHMCDDGIRRQMGEQLTETMQIICGYLTTARWMAAPACPWNLRLCVRLERLLWDLQALWGELVWSQ